MRNWLKLEKLLKKQPNHLKQVKLSKKEQAKIFILIGDLLTAGFSLRQAVTFLQTLLASHETMFKQIDLDLSEGCLLAESLKPFIDQDIYYQLIIAEEHGELKDCIGRLGQYLSMRVKQQAILKGLLQYPVILLSMLGVLLIALKLFVFPELETWQTQDTKVNTNDNLYLFGLGLCLLFVVSAILKGYQIWRSIDTNKKINYLCKLPIIGESYRLYYGYYLISNFSLLLSNGMGIKRICQMFAAFDAQSLLYQLGNSLNEILTEGDKPEKLLKEYSYLPLELIIFINKGATTRELGQQLDVFASVLFKRLAKSIEKLLTMIQPLLFGIIAIVIVLLYLSIMLPIYHSMKGIY